MVTRYYVMRQYSGHASRKCLLQMMSRGIKDKRDAEFELSWHQSLLPKSEFFLMSMEEEK